MIASAAVTTPAIGFFYWADRSLSQEARIVRGMIEDASKFSRSIVFGEPIRTAEETLASAIASSREEEWEGEARKVEASTYVYAGQFLKLLPSTFPVPEITADRDGEILFEWDRGPRRVFSVSVRRDGTLSFAGLFGHSKIHGTEPIGESLSSVISNCLARLATSPAS
jgi:hypothetical protein